MRPDQLFNAALEITDPAERQTCTDGARAGNAALQQEVESARTVGPLFLSLLLLATGCETLNDSQKGTVREQAYNTAAFETTLRRGISTREDVERTLGKPNGSGSIWFPTTSRPEDTWFYQRVLVDTSTGTIDTQMDMVLVFFKEDRLDGFMWFSDAEGTWRALP